MGLRAIVATSTVDGRFRGRHIYDDGCPTLIVPTLVAIWKQTFAGDLRVTVTELLAHSWTCLDAKQGPPPAWNTDGHTPRVGRYSPNDGPDDVLTGSLANANPGDHEWLYLFDGGRLTVAAGVGHRYNRRGTWWFAAVWPLDALPHVSADELRTVQSYGEHTRRCAEYGEPRSVHERLGRGL